MVTVRADDEQILRDCAANTALGRVEVGLKGRGKSSPQARWIVERKLDCFLLLAIFDTYPLRAKKARDYEIWREAVMCWHEIPSNARVNVDWTRIAALSSQLRANREFVG